MCLARGFSSSSVDTPRRRRWRLASGERRKRVARVVREHKQGLSKLHRRANDRQRLRSEAHFELSHFKHSRSLSQQTNKGLQAERAAAAESWSTRQSNASLEPAWPQQPRKARNASCRKQRFSLGKHIGLVCSARVCCLPQLRVARVQVRALLCLCVCALCARERVPSTLPTQRCASSRQHNSRAFSPRLTHTTQHTQARQLAAEGGLAYHAASAQLRRARHNAAWPPPIRRGGGGGRCSAPPFFAQRAPRLARGRQQQQQQQQEGAGLHAAPPPTQRGTMCRRRSQRATADAALTRAVAAASASAAAATTTATTTTAAPDRLDRARRQLAGGGAAVCALPAPPQPHPRDCAARPPRAPWRRS